MIQGILAERGAVGVLWGKSDADGQPNLLVQHLLDTAAVGELIWDRFLAPSVRQGWDAATDGGGRLLFMALCGLHDVGKATPAFQSKESVLAGAVQSAGLTWARLKPDERAWHHTVAGARILRDLLPEFGASAEATRWLWPFVAGHHGKVPSASRLAFPGRGACHGLGPDWPRAQAELVRLIGGELGVDWSRLAPVARVHRAAQLALLGTLVMADWVASNDGHFPGIPHAGEVSLARARQRAAEGWAALGLRGGWSTPALTRSEDPVLTRFGLPSRPGQQVVVAEAERIPAPGLLIVEAPMGEGKTEAALAAVEVLARRFGADGVFVGMPTQATSDPMFSRVRRWAAHVDDEVPVALLHGKARFNREWHDLRTHGRPRFSGVDEYRCTDDYGPMPQTSEAGGTGADQAPVEWFLGNKRGLLTPVVVGTVDQLLYAATRTRHVMLRHAGLVGKVVILDEVHAYDVYMAQFLHEALRWLAEAGVPVVVLSATLPPATRAELARSYLQGAIGARDVEMSGLPEPSGYPSCTAVCAVDGVPVFGSGSASTWRGTTDVTVEILDEPADGSSDAVVALLRERLADGGCALVVRNTVGRAQRTYQAVKQEFGADAVLLHARLTAGERADRTERVLELLGPPAPGRSRPHCLVVVATQLAEQSFDVDVDLLVTDLAPIDLLLQRIGRLHRHERPARARPERVRQPRVIVTGVSGPGPVVPTFPPGSRMVYGRYLLLRSAHLVFEAVSSSTGWSVPAEVPELVRRGYAEDADLPPIWREAAEQAELEQRTSETRRRAAAAAFLLAGPDDLGAKTLAGLHERPVNDPSGLDDEDVVAAVVRDGDPSVEVVLVRSDERGYLTLDGRSLGPTGEAVSNPEVLERVIRDVVRLRPELTEAAIDTLQPLAGWSADPWLARTRALVLDETFSAQLGSWQLTYDHDLGMTGARAGRTEGGR